MGKLSDLDLAFRESLELIEQAMHEDPIDLDQVCVESCLHSLVSNADDLIIALNDPTRAQYVMANEIGVGQALNRLQLLASSIEARKKPRLVGRA